MRAAIAGDIVGSRFEKSRWSGNTFETAACAAEKASDFKLFHPTCHLTDDSILTLAIAEWLLRGGDLKTLFRSHFRRCPRPERFSRLFRSWAASDTDEPCGSVGNGSAMRVSPVGYARESLEEVRVLARESALCTHRTEDAVRGAEAVAVGVFLARTGASKDEIEKRSLAVLEVPPSKPLDEIRDGYQFSSTCPDTIPVAIRAFVESNSVEETIRRAVSVGGDADTIACMAAAIAGAFWGTPVAFRSHVAAYLGAEQLDLLMEFEDRFPESARTIF